MSVEKQLIVSLHDVTPRDFDRIREIDRFYEAIGIGPRYAMLVVPNFWGRWPIDQSDDFARWLKDRVKAGVEIILHGFFHRDTTPPQDRALLTALGHAILGEGEFAAIDEEEAARRLTAGRIMLERTLEIDIDAFIAPAWQYSPGARAALSKLGFRIAEGRMGVWSPADGRPLSNTPVVAYSNRSAVRRSSSILWSQISSRTLRACGVVRHAIHPGDFDDPRLQTEIWRSLSDLRADRRIVRYRDLLKAPAA